MNKTQIFGMYLGADVWYEYETLNHCFRKGKLEGVDISEDVETALVDNYDYGLNYCQLTLKPISEMSEEDSQQFLSQFGYRIDVPTIAKDGYCYLGEFLWLIEHGYALDDSWFTNGIAIKDCGGKTK